MGRHDAQGVRGSSPLRPTTVRPTNSEQDLCAGYARPQSGTHAKCSSLWINPCASSRSAVAEDGFDVLNVTAERRADWVAVVGLEDACRLVAEQLPDLFEAHAGVVDQRCRGVAPLAFGDTGSTPASSHRDLTERRRLEGSMGVPTSVVNTNTKPRSSQAEPTRIRSSFWPMR